MYNPRPYPTIAISSIHNTFTEKYFRYSQEIIICNTGFHLYFWSRTTKVDRELQHNISIILQESIIDSITTSIPCDVITKKTIYGFVILGKEIVSVSLNYLYPTLRRNVFLCLRESGQVA